MTVTVMARRASGTLLRSLERSNSCPDLSNTISKMKMNQIGSVRNLNLMVMHPRAPKIRHLNASTALLIELEENVKKVQDLENTVVQLEKQLQWREIIKKAAVVQEATKLEAKILPKPAKISEEEQIAFRQRLEDAKRKSEQMSMKRDEQEAEILRDEFRSWHQKKLRVTIDEMLKQPENEIKYLPTPTEVGTESALFSDIDALVEMANFVPEPSTYKDELNKLKNLINERDSLGKLYNEVQEKDHKTIATIQECKNAITSINSMRIKLEASITMTKSLLNTMQNKELERRNQNMFVFGPNPIFSCAKELELNYSINNQFILDMLQELDMSFHVAQKNLKTAKGFRTGYKGSKLKLLESLQTLQEAIDHQTQHLNMFHTTFSKPNSSKISQNDQSEAQHFNIHGQNQVHENEV